MVTSSLIRRLRFEARHHYRRKDRDEAWNQGHYGDQLSPHSHTFRVEVRVEGEIDPETGFLADLERLDQAMETVFGPLRGADLNVAIPEVAEGRMQPSTEALALWALKGIDHELGTEGPRVRAVFVFEDDELGGGAERIHGGSDDARLHS